MNDTLTNLGSGVVLAWIALPLLAMAARRGDGCDPASSHRAYVWALVLGSVLWVLPFARAGADSSVAFALPEWLAHIVVLGRHPIFYSSLGSLSVMALVGLAWIAVVSVGALRALVYHMRLSRVRRSAQPAPAEVVARIEPLARTIGIRCPRILVSADCSIPFATGVFRPAVVLPRGVVESFTFDAVELVALHELTHVVRGDLRAAMAIELARILLGPHPTADRLARDACLMREQAVDACVAAHAPLAYARVLVDVAHHARFGERVARAICMHGSDLAVRIDAIEGMSDARPRRRASLAPLLVTTVAIAFSAFLAPRLELDRCPAARGRGDPCSASVDGPRHASTI